MKTETDIINQLTNIELKKLSVEIKKISKIEKPLYFKKSKQMKLLFTITKRKNLYFNDIYSIIKTNLSNEIINRFQNNNINL